jgi:hypothetical protein
MIHLEWTVATKGNGFRQTAEVHTNDPRYATIIFDIHGKVVDWLQLEPSDLVLSSVSASDGRNASFEIYAWDTEDLQVESFEFRNSETARYFDVRFEPGETPDLENRPAPSAVLRGIVTIKPGLPLGPIVQTIRLTTNIDQAPELELGISGSVVSDISIVGPKFRPEHNLLTFGQLNLGDGAEVLLRVLVKGPYREEVSLVVHETEPADVLQASLGERQSVNNGAVYMYPLTVKIDQDARRVARMGAGDSEYGLVKIETTHPTAKSIPIRVRFAIR